MKSTFRALLAILVLALIASLGVFAPVSVAQQDTATTAATVAAPAATLSATDSDVFPRTVKDGSGNDVVIKAKPVKIVSVSLASDEVLLSLVDHSRIAAVTANALDATQSNVSEVAKTIPAQLAKADPEQIIALKPDLVIISSFTDAGVVKQLKDAGLSVFLLSNFASIKDIETNILTLGQLTGDESKAAQIVNGMEQKLAKVAAAVKGVKPQTVIYYAPDGYSSGPGTTIDEIITRAGAVNGVTAGGIKDMFPQLSDEFMVKQDPDYVLLAGFNSYSPGFVENFKKKAAFQTLKAIKNGHVVVVNDAHLASISQYIVEGVSDVAALLYPDQYKPAPAATANATVAATMSATAGQ